MSEYAHRFTAAMVENNRALVELGVPEVEKADFFSDINDSSNMSDETDEAVHDLMLSYSRNINSQGSEKKRVMRSDDRARESSSESNRKIRSSSEKSVKSRDEIALWHKFQKNKKKVIALVLGSFLGFSGLMYTANRGEGDGQEVNSISQEKVDNNWLEGVTGEGFSISSVHAESMAEAEISVASELVSEREAAYGFTKEEMLIIDKIDESIGGEAGNLLDVNGNPELIFQSNLGKSLPTESYTRGILQELVKSGFDLSEDEKDSSAQGTKRFYLDGHNKVSQDEIYDYYENKSSYRAKIMIAISLAESDLQRDAVNYSHETGDNSITDILIYR